MTRRLLILVAAAALGLVGAAPALASHTYHVNFKNFPLDASDSVRDGTVLYNGTSLQLDSSGLHTMSYSDPFAHYAGEGGEPGKGPEATTLVRFDPDWREQGAWFFPRAVVSRWDGMSSSGGTWADERLLYTTGHHARELYMLELPASGRELALAGIISIESEGQGIALDRAAGLLYSIQRRTREVLVSKLPEL